MKEYRIFVIFILTSLSGDSFEDCIDEIKSCIDIDLAEEYRESFKLERIASYRSAGLLWKIKEQGVSLYTSEQHDLNLAGIPA